MSDHYVQATCRGTRAARAVAEDVRAQVGLTAGDPVVPLDGRRFLVGLEAIEDNFGGLDAFRAAYAHSGLEEAVPIPTERAVRYIELRRPDDLTISRAEFDDPPEGDRFDWHLRQCQLTDAWGLIDADFTAIDWQDVLVGQIDTGYLPLSVLGFDQSGGTWFDLNRDRNFFPLDKSHPLFDPNDARDLMTGAANDGHGLRTGSVLSGCLVRSRGQATIKGYFGAAPRVPCVPVRVCDSVIVSHVQEAIADAVHHLVAIQCNVITVSLGFPFGEATTIQSLRRAINDAYERGVIMTCAAGNYWSDVVAPACHARTIAVAGCTQDQVVWRHSADGNGVDVYAPADHVFRASPRHARGTLKQQFGFGDGTSYATALTAGAAALWLRRRRAELATRYTEPWQRVEAFRRLLRTTAWRPEGWNGRSLQTGILQARALLAAPLPAPADLVKQPGA